MNEPFEELSRNISDRASERKFAVLLESMDDAIIEKALDHTILSWNRSAERIFGYTSQEAVGQSMSLILSSGCLDILTALDSRALQGEAINQHEIVCVTKDDRRIDVSLILRPFSETATPDVEMLLIVRDVTEMKRTLARQSALVRAVIAAQEDERRRVAYDLHDGLTQYVMASHAHLETFRYAEQCNNPEKAQRELEQGLRYLKEAVVESRHLVNGLRSLALDNMGLANALEQLLKEEKVRAGWLEAFLVHNTGSRRYDKVLATAVFRVAQEALTNARKHAATQRVRMMLLESHDEAAAEPRLTLEVRDWGKGFDMERQTDPQDHVGLQSMLERTRLLDGTFEVQSVPGEGTMVRVVFTMSTSDFSTQ